MSVSCLCLSGAFVHNFFSQCWWNGLPQHCEFVCWLLLFVFCFCSHFPNDDIAIRSDS